MIGHQSSERYTALRDVISRNVKGLVRSARDMMGGRQLVQGDEVEEFWALKDVNFEIRRGDVVGVIGRNGAGKSTLLKILSRITEPSAGRVEIKGRVASLLEVGTGFHPELTGRENIFLNGAVLGMTRAEIKRKFDEIVAFAQVEKFLDTPVKHYSSGMYVRLAFAVAAHLEPEILVVDEVLAVGDAEFQKKCLGKMSEVAGQGRTVLFVSHNMGAIRALCPRAILLHRGAFELIDECSNVIERYSMISKARTMGASSAKRAVINCCIDAANSNNEQLILNIEGNMLVEGSYEMRVFINSVHGERIGIVSVGGFGSSGVNINSPKCKIWVDVTFLAKGIYMLEPEAIRIADGKIFKSNTIIDYIHSPSPLNGETVSLDSNWGIGYARFPAGLHKNISPYLSAIV
nr:ABC transporter ATP-binding protein [Methylocystis sp. WRRC1]